MRRTVPLPRASTSGTGSRSWTLSRVPPAKELLVGDEDVQVLHGFETAADAKAYLASELFTRDVVGGLTPLRTTAPDVRPL
jgi:hypothetical protein